MIGREKGEAAVFWVGLPEPEPEEKRRIKSWCNGSEMEAIELKEKEG